jgi:hypothetical protein
MCRVAKIFGRSVFPRARLAFARRQPARARANRGSRQSAIDALKLISRLRAAGVATGGALVC